MVRLNRFKILLFISLLILNTACKNQNNSSSATKNLDTISVVANKEILYMEDLLNINSHDELVKKYGEANAIKTRFYYADDTRGIPASIIFKGTDKEVAIEWNDTAHYKDLNAVYVRPYMKNDTAVPIYTSQWKSKTGLEMGMELNKVVELNGKGFTISGLGWDYGGGVISWDQGKFAINNTLSVNFAESGNHPNTLTSEELNQISGEVQINSSNIVIQKLNLVISFLSLRKNR